MCQDPGENYVGSPANMRTNQCAKAFVGPITELAILPAAQETVLQGRLLQKLVLNLSVAPAARHFPNELQLQIMQSEFLFTCFVWNSALRGVHGSCGGWAVLRVRAECLLPFPSTPSTRMSSFLGDTCQDQCRGGDKPLPCEKACLMSRE